MRDDREIDRRQHGLPRTVIDRVTAKQDLLGALRDDTQAQVVDAVEWFAWRTAPVQRQRRDAGVVVAVGLGKTPDGASEDVRHGNIVTFYLCCLRHFDNPSVASTVSVHCQFFYTDVISGKNIDGFGKRQGGHPARLGSP
jgi:hypothetical protein